MNPVDLMQSYFDNDLSEAERQALQRWLEEDPAHLEQLVIEAFIDGQLRDVLGEAKVRQDLLSLAHSTGPIRREPSAIPETASVPAPHVAQSSTSRRQRGGAADAQQIFRRLLAGNRTVAAVVAVIMLAVCIVAVVGTMTREQARRRPGAAQLAARPDSIPIAQLSRVAGVCWSGEPLQPGQRLSVGQALALDAGVLELTFDLGVRVVVQAPAVVKLESPASLRLEQGKLSAEITDVRARGFQVQTPKGKVVDLGTEFGVEVTPCQDVEVHVFRGEVVVEEASAAAASAGSHVFRNQGLRMESGTAGPLLVEEPGETYIRTIDDADRDKHVVAYWRFEDHPLGAVVPDTSANTKLVRGTVDSSFNGNDLFTFSASTRPRFSGDVPAGSVPQSGASNRGCLDNTTPPVEGSPTRDLYTRSRVSHAAPIDIQIVKLAKWTIEASVKAKVLNFSARALAEGHAGKAGAQTFVGRDGGQGAVMALRINSHDRFEIYFKDVKHHEHTAVANVPLRENQWYHVAAVSDGETLRLYVDARDGQGYQLGATAKLNPKRGSTALGATNPKAEWSVGRGRVNRTTCEWFQGWIDEVRISDAALEPSKFLFAPGSKEKQSEAMAPAKAGSVGGAAQQRGPEVTPRAGSQAGAGTSDNNPAELRRLGVGL